jgi:hypothetical protein
MKNSMMLCAISVMAMMGGCNLTHRYKDEERCITTTSGDEE